jgi:hypothetical protein
MFLLVPNMGAVREMGDCPNFCVSKNGTVPFCSGESPFDTEIETGPEMRGTEEVVAKTLLFHCDPFSTTPSVSFWELDESRRSPPTIPEFHGERVRRPNVVPLRGWL